MVGKKTNQTTCSQQWDGRRKLHANIKHVILHTCNKYNLLMNMLLLRVESMAVGSDEKSVVKQSERIKKATK